MTRTDAFFRFVGRVCRQLVLETALDVERNWDLLRKNDGACESNILSWNCKELFAEKPHIRALPSIVVNAENYSFLLSQLSLCSQNVLLIHNRQDLLKFVKPKLPRIVQNHRREFKYLPLSDDFDLYPGANVHQIC